jgi:hypothetical protein
VTLVDSDFPVHEIWRRHREGLDTAAVAAGDGDRLVVYRPALRARVQPVSHAAFRLLGAVDNGLRLAELAAGGYAVEQLGGLISDGIIVGFEPGGGGVPS